MFHDPSDTGEKHSLQTPSPQVMSENIDNFLKTWKNTSHANQAVLTIAAIKELENLKKCQERFFHIFLWCLQQAASKGRIGVALAVALLTSFLYKWNEKQATRR